MPDASPASAPDAIVRRKHSTHIGPTVAARMKPNTRPFANMRAILVILVAVLVAALGGCASVAWVKDGATPEQLAEDMKRCQQDSWYEARANTWYYRPMSPAYIPSAMSGRFVFSP